jgi:hypothetical protein
LRKIWLIFLKFQSFYACHFHFHPSAALLLTFLTNNEAKQSNQKVDLLSAPPSYVPDGPDVVQVHKQRLAFRLPTPDNYANLNKLTFLMHSNLFSCTYFLETKLQLSINRCC